MASPAEVPAPADCLEEGLSFEGAVELTKRGDIDEAIDAWATLLQDGIEKEGEMSPSVAPLYYRYGDALLRKAEESDDLFAGGDGEGAVEDGEEGVAAAAAAAAEDGAAQRENEDAMLAWEVLEVGRNLFEAQGTVGEEGLATTLLRLGDLQKLNGNVRDAIKDYERCVEIRRKLFDDASDRRIADVEWCLAVACEFAAAEKDCADPRGLRTKALDHYAACAASLEGLVATLKTTPDDKSKAELTELGEILDELRETIAAAAARDAEDAKAKAAQAPPAAAATTITTIGFGAPAAAAAPVVATLQPKKKQKREAAPEGDAATPLAPPTVNKNKN